VGHVHQASYDLVGPGIIHELDLGTVQDQEAVGGQILQAGHQVVLHLWISPAQDRAWQFYAFLK
jgi:hypothetical protein